MEITKIKQVEELAQKYFKCIARAIIDTHAKGYKGVKLIVGMKHNQAYDPSIDPNSPSLSQELKDNKDLLKNLTNPEAPDVRILWIPPGTTDQELIEKWLLPIKKSLEVKKPIITKDPTLTKIETESDADLAAKLASGEKVDSRVEEWDDGYATDDSDPLHNPRHEDVFSDGAETPKGAGGTEEKTNDTDKNDNTLDAIKQIAVNMETLSSDISEMSDSIINIEQRVNNIEKKPEPKPRAKTKK